MRFNQMLILKSNIIFLLVVAICFVLLIQSCNLFKTRNPEEPIIDNNNGAYPPRTKAEVVISNFYKAVKEKNVDKYIDCLSDTLQNAKSEFYFLSASDASKYGDIFRNWNISGERQYFLTMINALGDNISPELDITGDRIDFSSSDSVIYIADYYLFVNHNNSTKINKASGAFQFTIVPNNSGLWSISKWQDIAHPKDTLSTWSVLKAQFLN